MYFITQFTYLNKFIYLNTFNIEVTHRCSCNWCHTVVERASCIIINHRAAYSYINEACILNSYSTDTLYYFLANIVEMLYVKLYVYAICKHLLYMCSYYVSITGISTWIPACNRHSVHVIRANKLCHGYQVTFEYETVCMYQYT